MYKFFTHLLTTADAAAATTFSLSVQPATFIQFLQARPCGTKVSQIGDCECKSGQMLFQLSNQECQSNKPLRYPAMNIFKHQSKSTSAQTPHYT